MSQECSIMWLFTRVEEGDICEVERKRNMRKRIRLLSSSMLKFIWGSQCTSLGTIMYEPSTHACWTCGRSVVQGNEGTCWKMVFCFGCERFKSFRDRSRTTSNYRITTSNSGIGVNRPIWQTEDKVKLKTKSCRPTRLNQ